jgi:PPK2 family polyphosphate:nucleotide phosphotransferase
VNSSVERDLTIGGGAMKLSEGSAKHKSGAHRRGNVGYLEQFKVLPGTRVKLKDIDPAFKDGYRDHDAADEEIAQLQNRMRELQVLLYAQHRQSLLICLQAMDTGGKDGTISHVLGAMNPQGCRVAGFHEPTAEELAHDFLWRVHRVTPAAGEVVIFNRSHYEDVLIVRVHNLVPRDVWMPRYGQINAFEKGLVDRDTHILKFFLYISKEEQLKRFKDRLDDPAKQWKISEADYKERPFWDDYLSAYEDALSRCSTEYAPWFVIPANHKWFRNLAVARIVVEHLEALKMKYPKPTVDIEHIRREYHTATKD